MTHSFPTRRSSDLARPFYARSSKYGALMSAPGPWKDCAWASFVANGVKVKSWRGAGLRVTDSLFMFNAAFREAPAVPKIRIRDQRPDRKSGGWGPSGTVRVIRGGRRDIKKKNTTYMR